MYWVFTEEQLDDAIDEYVEQNTTEEIDDKEAYKKALKDFLTSASLHTRKMVRG